MSVILEFTIAPDEFALGRVLSGDVEVRLERIVPANDTPVPYLWAVGADTERLEGDVEASGRIERLSVVERVGSHTLYRVQWASDDETLLKAINDTGGVILEAHGNDVWSFRLRFLDHQEIAEFYNYCSENDLPIHVERVYTLTEETLQGRVFDLTTQQREALVLALEAGYFATPRETSMAALADELEISQQAFSERVRRGTEKVLANALEEG